MIAVGDTGAALSPSVFPWIAMCSPRRYKPAVLDWLKFEVKADGICRFAHEGGVKSAQRVTS
jgi:hypothetical protein